MFPLRSQLPVAFGVNHPLASGQHVLLVTHHRQGNFDRLFHRGLNVYNLATAISTSSIVFPKGCPDA
jgi:hypothetical protein